MLVIAGVVNVGAVVSGPRFGGAGLPYGIERFGQAEVQNLHRSVRPHLDVGGFEVAVDDAVVVRRFQRLGNLTRDRQRLVERQP